MDLKQLEYFVAVAEEGNISAAAKKLHISQPPLSIQMKHLEAELGCSLFERGARSIALTEAGKILYDRAKGMIDMASVTVRELEHMKTGMSGTLRLGMISSAGLSFVKETLKPFHEAYPGIRLDICEGNTYQLLDALQNHRIEAAVVRTPFPEEGYDCRYFQTDAMVAAGFPEFFTQSNKEKLDITDLEGVPLILYRRWEHILLHVFREEQIKADVFCMNDDARTALKLAAAGMGMALVPASAIEMISGTKIVFKDVNHQMLSSSLTLIKKKTSELSGPGRLFFDMFS